MRELDGKQRLCVYLLIQYTNYLADQARQYLDTAMQLDDKLVFVTNSYSLLENMSKLLETVQYESEIAAAQLEDIEQLMEKLERNHEPLKTLYCMQFQKAGKSLRAFSDKQDTLIDLFGDGVLETLFVTDKRRAS